MITIVNFGLGNLGSILNMFNRIGVQARISSTVKNIENSEKLVLPGVGSFETGMKRIYESGLLNVLNRRVIKEGIPILGICLGAQLFANKSEEGNLSGLGWIDAKVIKLDQSSYPLLKVPHMRWNSVIVKKSCNLFRGIKSDARFYFVHSYHIICKNYADIITTTVYGNEFVSSIQKENIMGVQFHPEKSHKFGLEVLKNFAEFSYGT